MILLDTHVLLWARSGDRRLGPRARREIDQALTANGVGVSAVSFWELEMLCQKRRIKIDYDVREWRRLLLHEGLTEFPLDGEVAIRAARLSDIGADPADRFIVATALAGHLLLTADRRILSWPGSLGRLDATR